MDGVELYQELDRKLKQLDACIRELRQTGGAYAEAERDYQVEKSRVSLELKAQKMPVGLITLVIKGMPSVARLLFERMSKEAIYKANQEAIMSLKLQIRIINDKINRDFGNPSAGRGA